MKTILILLMLNICMFGQSDDYLTVFEKSNFTNTGSYEVSMNLFKKFAKNSEYCKIEKFGESPQHRKLFSIIVSKEKIFDPAEIKSSGKSVIFVNNGIHSGEIEGKDASAIILREMLVEKKIPIPENVVLVIVPIFNVDGHERKSKYNRINQNGPEEMGWRTTAQNINLNRDFVKADAPEMKAWLKLYQRWIPDILIDIHTTNGADYQYTITYGIEKFKNLPSKTADWARNTLLPHFKKQTEKAGYLVAPYVWFRGKFENGFRDWVCSPKLSNGYTAVQNRPGFLVETHMLKPYKERVFAVKAVIKSVIDLFEENSNEIVKMNLAGDEEIIEKYSVNKKFFPIAFGLSDDKIDFPFKGFERKRVYSEIAGTEIVKYTDKKKTFNIPFYNRPIVTDSVKAPEYYIIPPEWKSIVDILELHGVEYEIIESDTSLTVEVYEFYDVKLASNSFEGRQMANYKYNSTESTVNIPCGSFLIKTAQRTLPIMLHALEPKSNDSFVKFGFFNIIFERKEYFEFYSMEPIAQKMYDESEELRKEFDQKVKNDSTFAKSPYQRLNFFYKRSKYYDKKHNKYPVLRIN